MSRGTEKYLECVCDLDRCGAVQARRGKRVSTMSEAARARVRKADHVLLPAIRVIVQVRMNRRMQIVIMSRRVANSFPPQRAPTPKMIVAPDHMTPATKHWWKKHNSIPYMWAIGRIFPMSLTVKYEVSQV